ncbi:MAG TPA: hypothetical protein EYG89_04205 [Bacteroidia bacterium]|nr:hypothetical protein [Bacteroidia bacterium]
MPYIERVNVKSGEFVLVTPLKRVYFDFNPNFYKEGVGSITNSLRKKFPIPRPKIIEMVEKKYFSSQWWKKHLVDAKAHAKGCFKSGAIDTYWDENGEVCETRYV